LPTERKRERDTLSENGTEGPGDTAGARDGRHCLQETGSTTGSDEDITEEPVINWESLLKMSRRETP
jgi:hypothetical protein